MSDIMRPMPFAHLMNWILSEYRAQGSVFGVSKLVRHADGKSLPIFEEKIESPYGPAAGPHTQLAQNIIAAYAAGSRFFEVKTVQVMDGEELSKCVSKPCITAADECYNCEWSTELYVPQAFAEYVKAWFACKLLAEAAQAENGVCAYVEPTLVGAGDLEAAVPANFNLITYEAEQLGRQSFYGQGAGRFPTAENVVQDCLTVLSGKRGFYTDRAVPMFLTSGEAHPYYVRTSAPDAFLRSRTAETWDNGAVITGAVDVYEMLAWAKAQREKDPGVFIAGIR